MISSVYNSFSTNRVSDSAEHEKSIIRNCRTISNTTNEEGSFVESPVASPTTGSGKRKRGKRGRARRNKLASNNSPANIPLDNPDTADHSSYHSRISKRSHLSRVDSSDYLEDGENHDPSFVMPSTNNYEDSNSSASINTEEPARKRVTRSQRVVRHRNRKAQSTSKKEVSFQDSDESLVGQDRSMKSLRERTHANMMPPPSTTKEGPLLSPLVEGEGVITVTTTTCTLSPSKTASAFITPHSKRKKLFTATPANEVR